MGICSHSIIKTYWNVFTRRNLSQVTRIGRKASTIFSPKVRKGKVNEINRLKGQKSTWKTCWNKRNYQVDWSALWKVSEIFWETYWYCRRKIRRIKTNLNRWSEFQTKPSNTKRSRHFDQGFEKSGFFNRSRGIGCKWNSNLQRKQWVLDKEGGIRDKPRIISNIKQFSRERVWVMGLAWQLLCD